ncbi:MAG: hypothetical protein GY755_12560 [Chloroflexi bacterium]|nr:hypothetical protein [Chloroflexota bacterium]
MKIKIVLITLIYIFFLSGCISVTPYATPPTASPTSSNLTTIPVATNTPTQTSTPTATSTLRSYRPTPETLYGFPTPEIMVLPTCGVDGCWLNFTPEPQRSDITFHELYVGKYVVRNWCDTDPKVNYFPASCAVIISSKGMEQIEIWGYGKAWVGAETGADLTGNGIPEIVIDTWNGAANDGTAKFVYEAGETLTKIMQAHGDGNFIDLNEDGAYEYVTPRRIWTSIPSVSNVWFYDAYEYQNDTSYMVSTKKFMEQINDIQINLDALSEFEEEYPDASLQFEVFDHDHGPAEASLYRIVAYYLLAEEENTALEFLNKYFSEKKASEYLLVIKSDIGIR